MIKYDIIIIGAGASGFCAAIEAARSDSKLTIALLDRMPRAGKKILVTGNGKCNLTNIGALPEKYNNPDFVSPAFKSFNVQSNLAFFESMGLLSFTDSEGRVYPMSATASSVLDVLRFEAEKLNIDIICDERVNEILFNGAHFIVNRKFETSAVVLACGGKSSSVHGSDGSGYALVKSFGHSITKLYPSLVQIKTEQSFVKQLKGIRINAKICVECDGQSRAEAVGEILFTDYGLSGIASMEISKTAAMCCQNDCYAEIDMLPTVSFDKIVSIIEGIISGNPSLTIENLLVGLLPKRVGQAVCKDVVDLKQTEPVSNLKKYQINEIANDIKHKKIKITGTNGFEQAQVTSGGADTSLFDADTLSSKLRSGLYACGELLDIDAGCGGYNLQWAWSSGRLAGKNAAEYVKARKKNYD